MAIESPSVPQEGKFVPLQEMSSEQVSQFMKDGKMIDKPAEKTPAATPETSAATADSATAEPAAQVASTDASTEAASEPAKPEKKAKGKSLTERNEHLRAEIEENTRLLNLREEQRRKLDARDSAPVEKPAAQPTDSAPADAGDLKKEIARIKALPGAPKWQAYEDMDDYTAAMALFVTEQLSKSTFERMFSEKSELANREAETQAQVRELDGKLDAQYKAHPDLVEKIDPQFLNVVPSRHLPPNVEPKAHHFAKDLILFECENTLQLGAFYSTPEGQAEWQKMMRMNPAQITRTLAIRDHSFGADSQDAATDDEAPAPSVHVSKAPPPSPVAGRKTAAPSDPLQTAIKSGDFRTFEKLENERLVAKKTRKSA